MEKKPNRDRLSKPLATRVPIEDYLKFRAEAAEKGLSISDWLLFRIYQAPVVIKHEKQVDTPINPNKSEFDGLKDCVRYFESSITDILQIEPDWHREGKIKTGLDYQNLCQVQRKKLLELLNLSRKKFKK